MVVHLRAITTSVLNKSLDISGLSSSHSNSFRKGDDSFLKLKGHSESEIMKKGR